MKRQLISIFIGFGSLMFVATPAFAHMIVYPHQTGIAQTQDFTVSVPNERDNPVVSVRLLMPKGLSDVLPNATVGWTITPQSNRSGVHATVTEIDWTGGAIPVGQREEFIFQAQVPPEPIALVWKAYQTYSDGTVVSWDVDPAKMSKLSDAAQDALADKENKGEYSTTQVINDLVASNTMISEANAAEQNAQIAVLSSIIAVIVSAGALYVSLKNKK